LWGGPKKDFMPTRVLPSLDLNAPFDYRASEVDLIIVDETGPVDKFPKARVLLDYLMESDWQPIYVFIYIHIFLYVCIYKCINITYIYI